MNVNFAHVCDYALLDAAGKPSVIGIFDQFNHSDFKKPLPPFFFIFEIGFSVGEFDRDLTSEITLRDADGQKIFEAKSGFRLNKPPGKTDTYSMKAPQVLHMRSLKLPRPGAYTFSIFLDRALKHELVIQAHQAPAAPATGG